MQANFVASYEQERRILAETSTTAKTYVIS
jgi:hypothetical protein